MSELKTAKDIIVEYLKANGFDGLCGDSCGCGIDYLAPCESGPIKCHPAYKIPRKCAECKNPCVAYDTDHSEGFCYSKIKPEGHTPRPQCGDAQDVTRAKCEKIKLEIIKEEFERWKEDDVNTNEEFERWKEDDVNTNEECGFANQYINDEADECEFLAHGFYGGFRAAEPLVKIKVLEKLTETHVLSPKTYHEIIQDMLAELKEVKR